MFYHEFYELWNFLNYTNYKTKESICLSSVLNNLLSSQKNRSDSFIYI